jgi:hypothetical protein
MMNLTSNPESGRLATFEGQSQRCLVGVNVAWYSDASVQALFGEKPASNETATDARAGTLTPPLAPCPTNQKQN